MPTVENQNYFFRGGIRINYFLATWPFGEIEVGQDELIIRNTAFKRDREEIGLRREVRFSKNDKINIEIKRYFPFFAWGIKIETHDTVIYFWVFHLQKLIDVLKQTGWLTTNESLL